MDGLPRVSDSKRLATWPDLLQLVHHRLRRLISKPTTNVGLVDPGWFMFFGILWPLLSIALSVLLLFVWARLEFWAGIRLSGLFFLGVPFVALVRTVNHRGSYWRHCARHYKPLDWILVAGLLASASVPWSLAVAFWSNILS
jgi:hypothetical protein